MATFRAANINHNGVLSRPEVGSMMRRLLGAISAQEVVNLISEIPSNTDNKVSLKEFEVWLNAKAPPKLMTELQRHLSTDADIVRAAFRVWDHNGDGLISRPDVCRIMRVANPDFTTERSITLLNVMDADHDGKVDYDEFTDF